MVENVVAVVGEIVVELFSGNGSFVVALDVLVDELYILLDGVVVEVVASSVMVVEVVASSVMVVVVGICIRMVLVEVVDKQIDMDTAL